MKSRLFLLMFFVSVVGSKAQLSVSSLLEYQLGNIPFDTPKNYSTNYAQVNLAYQYQNIRTKMKLQNFSSPISSRSFSEVAQRSIEFRDKGFQLTLGHFYEIFGRGLYLRSYELPAVTLEQQGFRKRYGFYRDIDGVLLKYSNDFFEAKVLRGKPLNNTLPPGFEEDFRRPNILEGAEVAFNVFDGWTFGGSYLRDNKNESFKEYGSLNIGGNLPGDVQFYTEYAQQMGTGNPLLSLSNGSVHALYSSLNAFVGPVGFSLEYKDYNDFTFGFNDPPPLIKEHQYILLNRKTHVLFPQNETGWQAEAIYSLPGGHNLTFNITEAVNEFFTTRYVFQEQFAELSYFLSDQTLLKAFVDRSQEPLFLEKDRFTGGFYWENEWPNLWGTSFEIEYQTYDFDVSPKQKVENTAVALTISKAPKFSGGLVWERSTDRGLTDDPTTQVQETKPRNWIGYSLGYQYSNSHFFSLFYGKRRGGPACTAGICYEVLPFEGFELRLTSNF